MDKHNQTYRALLSIYLYRRPWRWTSTTKPTGHIYLSIYIGLIEAFYSTCIVVFHLNALTWFSLCTIVQCTLTKVFWLSWDLKLLQVRGSFWTKGIQRGMIQQKVLTAGHPTLYFCYKSKPLFNTWDIFTVIFFYEKLLVIYLSTSLYL